MTGQSVAVMVWADPAVRIDYPNLQLDLAGAIQSQLNPQDKKKQPKEMKETTWPWRPQSVVRYQHDHPELDGDNITDVAPRLKVSRLVYVEVDSLQTRSDYSMELYRGRVSGTLKVVEVENGTARVAYEEPDIEAIFPKKSPEEGVAELGDSKTYAGAVASFAVEVVHRLVAYQEEE
jgi:hypothetical protein